ncbi:uncharacterized protein LOC115692600 [Syzygium oleosum]|uniref:uncharacterized protein LOC115692600 n=1 Tax=Syzygium oleosum TaxID=219896 RepID=UPI0024B9E6D0|nr:uncharacterized protein LOC115692600 [Syzygium oleosum]
MPQWILPHEKGSVSFMASKDLYDKFLGVALCFVVSNDAKEKKAVFQVDTHIDGTQWKGITQMNSHSLDSDHIMFQYMTPYKVWGAVDFGHIDGNYVEFKFTISGGVKKWGFRIICRHLRDDLKVELRDNRLIDPALLYEVGHESIDSAAGSSLIHEDNSSEADLQKDLQECQMSTEKYSQREIIGISPPRRANQDYADF